MLYRESVAPPLWELLQQLQRLPLLHSFLLFGGTALALHRGHRLSVDLDLFTVEEFDSAAVIEELRSRFGPRFELVEQQRQTVLGRIDGIKVDLIRHNYPLVAPPFERDGVRLASLPDLAATKLGAVAGRGVKKDFFDLDELLRWSDLQSLLGFYSEKYGESSLFGVVKSLVWFEDAELDPAPMVSGGGPTWEEVKARLRSALRLSEL